MRKKRRYKFTDKNQSKRGIRSCLMGLGSLLLVGVSLASAYARMGQAGKQVAIFGFLAWVLSMAGLYYGVLGSKEEDSYMLIPRIGCVLNAVMFLACVEIYILGW